MRHLIIDGMLSGTGVRDAAAGGYLDPKVVGLSADLTKRIANWLIEYENAHYHQFVDKGGERPARPRRNCNCQVRSKGAARHTG